MFCGVLLPRIFEDSVQHSCVIPNALKNDLAALKSKISKLYTLKICSFKVHLNYIYPMEIYIYIYVCVKREIYIYIYRERERDGGER